MERQHEQESQALRQVLQWLVRAGVVPQAADTLKASMQDARRTLRDAVIAEVPALAASANRGEQPPSSQHTDDHVRQILHLLDGGEVGSFEFVRQRARLSAEQRFPLEAVLHAYRCGHRILSHWIRDAAIKCNPANLEEAVSAVADFSIEYTNLISSIATSEYVAHTRLLAEAESDLRTELLNTLLAGYDESDARVARLLRRAGYLDQRLSHCVVVAQPVNAAEMENPARAQRIVNSISDVVTGNSLRKLAGIRDNLVTFMFSDRRRQSGWTAPQADLAERLHPLLLALGPSVLVGISADHPSPSFAPRALHEAKIALDFANHAKRVVGFSALPLRSLLVHHGSSYLQAAPPAWATALAGADTRAEGALIQTLRAVADADMNVQKAARLLGKHPNTIYARIERIRELTGLDGQRYRDLTELLLAADCWQSGNAAR